MSESEFVSNWYLGMAIAAVVVVVVAAVALTLIVTARRIRDNAHRALGVAQEIVGNTRPIWLLSETDTVVEDLEAASKSIAKHTGELADAVDGAGQRPSAPSAKAGGSP